MEWLSRLFDITKLPSKFFAIAAAIAAAFLFLPTALQTQLHIDSLPPEYKGYAGVALIAAVSFLTINLFLWVLAKIGGWRVRRLARLQVVKAIKLLDESEKAVLREFWLQERHVIELPVDHPTVTGLMRKGVLVLFGKHGYAGIAGSVFPVARSQVALDFLELEHVDFPSNLTDEAAHLILNARPSFIREIRRHDQGRAGF